MCLPCRRASRIPVAAATPPSRVGSETTTKAVKSRASNTKPSPNSPCARVNGSSPRPAPSSASTMPAACIAWVHSRSVTSPCGWASAPVTATRRSARVATSSTRSSTAYQSGRRSITSRGRRDGSTASVAPPRLRISMTMSMHTSITTIMATIMIMAMTTRRMRISRRRNLTIRDRCGCARLVRPGRHDCAPAP